MSINAIAKATKALEERFKGAVIESEKIPNSNRYQLLIISDAFSRMRPFRRQDVVWDIIKNAVTAEEILKISFVLPVPPSEITRMPAKARTRSRKVLQPH